MTDMLQGTLQDHLWMPLLEALDPLDEATVRTLRDALVEEPDSPFQPIETPPTEDRHVGQDGRGRQWYAVPTAELEKLGGIARGAVEALGNLKVGTALVGLLDVILWVWRARRRRIAVTELQAFVLLELRKFSEGTTAEALGRRLWTSGNSTKLVLHELNQIKGLSGGLLEEQGGIWKANV